MKTNPFPALVIAIGISAAASAQQMNYQGRLTDNAGAPRPGPQATLSFSLWDAATGGTKVWGDFMIAADLIDGRFSVKLGDAAGDDGTGRFLTGAFGGPRFLQIQVGADAPLPRQEVLPSPVALHAANAEEIIADDLRLTVQNAPSLPGGPSNFLPDGGRAGWLMEFRDSVDTNHAGLFMNGNTMALYNSGTNGLLNIYAENELSDPSPAGPKFQVDENGGVVSNGGGSFSGNLEVNGTTSLDGFTSDGNAEVNGDASIRGDLVIYDQRPADSVNVTSNYPFEIRGTTYPGGVATPDQRLLGYQLSSDTDDDHLNNSVADAFIIRWGTAFKPGGGPFAALSDGRLKRDVEDLHGSLDRLTRLRPVNFEFKNPDRHGAKGTQTGFIAQEVEEVFPEWVVQMRNDDPLSEGEEAEPEMVKAIGVTGFEALAVDALRELRAEKDRQIDDLRSSTDRKISSLEEENAVLRDRLSGLEEKLGKLASSLENFQDSRTAQR